MLLTADAHAYLRNHFTSAHAMTVQSADLLLGSDFGEYLAELLSKPWNTPERVIGWVEHNFPTWVRKRIEAAAMASAGT